MAAYSDAAKYEILYDLKEGEYSQQQVGGIRTKTIRAGDSLEVEAFPMVRIEPAARAEARRRGTSAAQEKLNLKNRRKRVRRLLETNFNSVDYILHLTFDYGFIDRAFCNLEQARREMEEQGFPMDDEDARRIIRNFLLRLKRLIKRKGGDPKQFKYIYVIETTKEPRDEDMNTLPARYHYHLVISSLELITIEDINALWDWGYTKTQALDFRFNGLEGLSKYITKQKRFARRYAHSRNLKEPDIRVSDRKISRRRAALMAGDIQANGREILESIYPGYILEECTVRYSDFAAGAYIYARMRRRRENKMQRRR